MYVRMLASTIRSTFQELTLSDQLAAAHSVTGSSKTPKENSLIDTSLDNAYAEELMRQCPAAGANPSTTVKKDPKTSFAFDN